MTRQRQVEEILISIGSSPSSKVAEELMKRGLTHDAAKKAISISDRPVMKLSRILKDGESFVYIENQFGSEEFYKALEECLKERGKQHYYVLQSLKEYGSLSFDKLACFSASPILKQKGHKIFETVLADLVRAGLVLKNGINYHYRGATLDEYPFKELKLELHENILFTLVEEWIKKNSFGSYNSVKTYELVHGYKWCITAPSYLLPFRISKGKDNGFDPGFIAIDIHLNTEIKNYDYFLVKVSNISAKSGNNFLPIILSLRFEQVQYEALRSAGVVAATFDTWFNSSINEILKEIDAVLKDIKRVFQSDQKRVSSVISNLGKYVAGGSLNLKGELFEFMTAYLFLKLGFIDIDIKKKIKIPNANNYEEIDLYAFRPQEMAFVECKGRTSKFTMSDYEKVVNKKLPACKNFLSSEDSKYANSKRTFYILSTGGFEEDVIEKHLSFNNKKINLELWDYDIIYGKFRSNNEKETLDAFKSFFPKPNL